MVKGMTNKWAEEIQRLLACNTIEECNSIAQQDLHTLDLINKGLRLLKWHNLPPEIDPRILSFNLFFKGKVIWFKSETLGLFALPTVLKGGLNAYGRFTQASPIALGNDSANLNNLTFTIDEDCVIMRDNDLGVPPLLYACYYGEKLSKLYDARDNNNLWLTLPIILKSSKDPDKDKKNGLVVKSIISDRGVKLPCITDAFNDLTLLDLKPQYFGGELQEQIKVIKNDYYEYLGVDHHEEKKERLTTEEVIRNTVENSLNVSKRLDCIKESVEKVNKMFGLNISVELNDSVSATESVETSTLISSKGVR